VLVPFLDLKELPHVLVWGHTLEGCAGVIP
jgi:hypothetical protein